MPRDLLQLTQWVEEALANGVTLNLQAQAHARGILAELETPPADWPQFSSGLDERLYFSANYLICSGLELLEGIGYEGLGARALVSGAESLEFLGTASNDSRFGKPLETLKAAVAYHIADHHARAYVLVERIKESQGLDDWLSQMILHFLDRDLLALRRITLEVFDSPETNDFTLSEKLESEAFDETTAVANLGERSLAGAISIYLEYLKTGRGELLRDALEVLLKVIGLAREARLADLWWWANALRYLLREFGNSSLWNGLRDFSPDGATSGLIWRYIRGCLIRKPPITSLWPSQRPAIEWITRGDRPSFCVRMPTSAGKTRVAELSILKALIDGAGDPLSKCVYIAPFRSLAVEVERALQRGLRVLGVKVSEIYGGFELSKMERGLVEDTQVLIATPEKLDAIIRQAPDLIAGVKLFVIDEGHLAGDVSNRGIRAEFLLNRLLNSFPRPDCRYLFLSGVLPNPEDFARWIGGNSQHLISTEWRPSRLMIGRCEWNRKRIRLEFTHEGRKKFRQTCFVPEFATIRACRGISPGWTRRNPFPFDDSEAFAVAAIRFALQGTTLAFIPQARYVESVGRQILSALKIERMLDAADGVIHRWKHVETNEAWTKCRTVITEELGSNSDLLLFLNEGFVVHHSNLPTRVRLSFEALIRTGEVPLIIATTTLSSGVNLPIRTVLVRGLQQSQNKEVSEIEFWNIAGRAGRAMCENEGQIVFFIDETRASWQVARLNNRIERIVESASRSEVLGALYYILSSINSLWKSVHNAPELTLLCLKLAEDDFDWAGENKPELEGLTAIIDQHLLALTSEAALDSDSLDTLQELLRQSLLFTRLGAAPLDGLDGPAALGILHSRLRSIHRRVPDQGKRGDFYRLGLSINDCSLVEAEGDALLSKYRRAKDWSDWELETRIEFLQDLATFALKLETIRDEVGERLPKDFREILRGWLSGNRAIEIAASRNNVGDDNDPARLAKIIETFCVYGLSWAANSLYGHLSARAEDSGDPLPSVCSCFSSMFKFGVCDPLAALFAPYLDGNRTLAQRAGAICPYSINNSDRALAWLHEVTTEDLATLGLGAPEADAIVRLRRSRRNIDSSEYDEERYRFTLRSSATFALGAGDRILVKPDVNHGHRSFELYTAKGNSLGRYQLAEELPGWWSCLDEMDAEVDETFRDEAENLMVIVRIRRI